MDEKPQTSNILSKLNPWLQFTIYTITIIGLGWGVVKFFIPIGETDLSLWIEEEVPIELPSEVNDMPLKLMYNNNLIRQATFVKIKVINTGSKSIGSNHQMEQITLKTIDSSRIVLVAQPNSEPSNIEVHVDPGSPEGSLILYVGLLNPRDVINLSLMIINPHYPKHPEIAAETRIPNLYKPTVTHETVTDRVSASFRWPLLIICWIITTILLVKPVMKSNPTNTLWKKTMLILQIFTLSLILSFAIGSALAEGLSRLVLVAIK